MPSTPEPLTMNLKAYASTLEPLTMNSKPFAKHTRTPDHEPQTLYAEPSTLRPAPGKHEVTAHL